MRPVGPRPAAAWRLAAATVLTGLVLSGCSVEPVTPHAEKINDFYNIVLVLAVLVWAGVVGAILWSVVRYKKRPGDDELPPQTHGNTTFEVIWTAVPTLIVLGLFAMSYDALRDIDRRTPRAELGAIIEARGFQWDWQFNYGDGVIVKSAKAGEPPVMVVPVGETVRVEERADNVIHALYIPEFLFKRDVVPGHANSFDFMVDAPGEFFGQCAELCGTGHAVMTFKVKAVGRAEFDQWLKEQKAAAALKECEAQPESPLTIGTHPTDLKFDKECVTVPAGQPVELTYRHAGDQPHNVAVFTKDPQLGGTELAKTAVISSGSAKTTVPAQEPGNYYFFCQVHPVQMTGTYTVK